jgi:hypothetical protein
MASTGRSLSSILPPYVLWDQVKNRTQARRSCATGFDHFVVEAQGIPLTVSLTGGNRHDVTQLLPLVEAIALIRDKRGRPPSNPALFRAIAATTTNIARRRHRHSKQWTSVFLGQPHFCAFVSNASQW